MSYREADLSRLKTVPIAGRANKVEERFLAHPPGTDRSFHAFLDSLPDILAARDLRTVIDHVARAHTTGRGVILLLGGHVIKVGLGPLLRDWIHRGIVSHVAMNGAAAIHDFELAAYGGTSEDVAEGLSDGSFGMAEETGAEMNAAIRSAAQGSSRIMDKREILSRIDSVGLSPVGENLTGQLNAAIEPRNQPLRHGRNYATLIEQRGSPAPAG